MKATRRHFLQRTAVLAMVSAGSLRAFAQNQGSTIQEEIGNSTMNSATAATFEKWIGGKFRTYLRGVSKGTMVLAAVESALVPRPKSTQGNIEREPMATSQQPVEVVELEAICLSFTRVGKRILQETYTLDHDWLGRFDLFIVPLTLIGKPSLPTYVAVITRPTGKIVTMG